MFLLFLFCCDEVTFYSEFLISTYIVHTSYPSPPQHNLLIFEPIPDLPEQCVLLALILNETNNFFINMQTPTLFEGENKFDNLYSF